MILYDPLYKKNVWKDWAIFLGEFDWRMRKKLVVGGVDGLSLVSPKIIKESQQNQGINEI